MASDFAAMLDEMMGPERNIDLDKVTGKRRRFDDEDVDRHFLVGCSPYQLFQGSKKNITRGGRAKHAASFVAFSCSCCLYEWGLWVLSV